MGQNDRVIHKPPSRMRYEATHPILSLRLSKDIRDILKQRLKDLGLSASEFIRMSLGVLDVKLPGLEEIKMRARDDGYSDGVSKSGIWYPCYICGERIAIQPDSDSHRAILKYMKVNGWRHTSCSPKAKG